MQTGASVRAAEWVQEQLASSTAIENRSSIASRSRSRQARQDRNRDPAPRRLEVHGQRRTSRSTFAAIRSPCATTSAPRASGVAPASWMTKGSRSTPPATARSSIRIAARGSVLGSPEAGSPWIESRAYRSPRERFRRAPLRTHRGQPARTSRVTSMPVAGSTCSSGGAMPTALASAQIRASDRRRSMRVGALRCAPRPSSAEPHTNNFHCSTRCNPPDLGAAIEAEGAEHRAQNARS